MNSKLKKILIVIFIFIESMVFLLHLIPYHFNFAVPYDIYYILYFNIILVFIISFIDYKKWDKSHVLMRICFFFTLIADFFLTYLDKYYHLSLILFILVQLSYFVLINYLFKNKYLKSSIFTYINVVSFLLIVGNFLELINSLNIIAIFYFSLSLINIIYLFRIKSKSNYINCFLIGLILFLLCDTCIGLRNIGITNHAFIDVVSSLIWIFYAPSQVILVLSLINVVNNEVIYNEKNN